MIGGVDTADRTDLVMDNIRFSFPSANGSPAKEIFEGFRLRVQSRSTLVVMGASGVGKSTLGRLIARGQEPPAGRIRYPCTVRRSWDIACVDQYPMNTVFPWQTVSRNIEYPLRKLGWTRTDRSERVRRLLSGFCLTQLGSAYPAHLSGGELQRLALARSFSWGPKLVILDEALTALDVGTRADVIGSLRTIVAEDGTTVILITHSISDALALGERCIVLGGRPARIVTDFQIQPQTLTAPVLQKALLEAIRDGHL